MFVAKHSSKKKLIETSFLLSWTKLMGPGLGRGFRVWSSAFSLTNVARFLRQPWERSWNGRGGIEGGRVRRVGGTCFPGMSIFSRPSWCHGSKGWCLLLFEILHRTKENEIVCDCPTVQQRWYISMGVRRVPPQRFERVEIQNLQFRLEKGICCKKPACLCYLPLCHFHFLSSVCCDFIW
jgi:hypothetical protein